MNFTEIITEFIKQNVFAGMLVFVIAIFIWYFADERKHYRSIFNDLKEESNKIHTTILFIEDRTKRLEDGMKVLSQDDSDMHDALKDIKSSLKNIVIIINERIK